MKDTIADLLVVLLPAGASLARWRRSGQLGRQLPLLNELAKSHGRLILAGFGGPDDLAIAHELAIPADILFNDGDQNDHKAWARALPDELAELVDGAESAIVRTTQLNTPRLAVACAAALKHRGIRTALIARGSAIPSRLLGRDLSFDHTRVRRATADEALLTSAADLVVAPTGKIADDLAWRYALGPSRISVVPTLVAASKTVPTPVDRDEATLLFAGQLVARKRIDVLIRAAAELRDVHAMPTHVRIIGDGPEFETLNALACELDVNVTIHRAAPHEELVEAMRRCTMYVQASEYETHPETVIEAMSLGCPVVVADAPGLAAVVNHPTIGMRVNANPTDFARTIAGLLAEPELRQMMGETAAQTIRESCSLEVVLPLELEAHRQALRTAQSRAQLAA